MHTRIKASLHVYIWVFLHLNICIIYVSVTALASDFKDFQRSPLVSELCLRKTINTNQYQSKQSQLLTVFCTLFFSERIKWVWFSKCTSRFQSMQDKSSKWPDAQPPPFNTCTTNLHYLGGHHWWDQRSRAALILWSSSTSIRCSHVSELTCCVSMTSVVRAALLTDSAVSSSLFLESKACDESVLYTRTPWLSRGRSAEAGVYKGLLISLGALYWQFSQLKKVISKVFK